MQKTGRISDVRSSAEKYYQYDAHDRLIHEYEAHVDQPGIRQEEKAYVVKGGHRVAVLESQAGNWVVAQLMLPDPTADRMLAEEVRGSSPYTIWPMHDHQDTVVAAFAKDWHVSADDIQQFAYDVLGRPLPNPQQDPSLADHLTMLHAARSYDGTAELYYNRARWYDPAAGRFISEDPIGFAGGNTNLYGYCGNSPANATNPSGLVVESQSGGVSFSDVWADFGYYLNPLNNDAGEWYFGAGKVTGWLMFVGGSAGAGLFGGAAALGGGALGYGVSGTATVVGGTAAAMQVNAANPNAGLHEYAFATGLGAGFGGRFPVAGAWHATGTLAGGGIGWATGGQFFGQSMQWGGLAGGIAGGGLQNGWRMAAWEAGGALGGAGVGYGIYGTPEGALLGANLGTFAGGIGQGVYGRIRRTSQVGARLRAPSEPDSPPRWDANHPLIEGTVDTPRSRAHVLLQEAVAEEMQASGYYQRVSMRQKLSKFSGVRLIDDIEPDNMGMTIDGQFDLIEIMSRWDTRDRLKEKLLRALNQFPPHKRGGICVIDPRDIFG